MTSTQKNTVSVQSHLSILLVEEFIEHPVDVQTALLSFGYRISLHSPTTEGLLGHCQQLNPDILILRMDLPTSHTFKALTTVTSVA